MGNTLMRVCPPFQHKSSLSCVFVTCMCTLQGNTPQKDWGSCFFFGQILIFTVLVTFADGNQSSSRSAHVAARLTEAAVKVTEGARSTVLWSQVDLRVEGLRHGGVACFAGGLFRVQRHFGTLNDNVMDFILFPSTKKSKPQWDKRKMGNMPTYAGPRDTDLVGSSSWSFVPVTSSGWMRTCSNIGWT